MVLWSNLIRLNDGDCLYRVRASLGADELLGSYSHYLSAREKSVESESVSRKRFYTLHTKIKVSWAVYKPPKIPMATEARRVKWHLGQNVFTNKPQKGIVECIFCQVSVRINSCGGGKVFEWPKGNYSELSTNSRYRKMANAVLCYCWAKYIRGRMTWQTSKIYYLETSCLDFAW